MRFGKIIEREKNEKVKVISGTVDYKDFKSVYLQMDTWVTPLCDSIKARNKIKLLPFLMRRHLTQKINKNLFRDKFITNIDFKINGIKGNKKSFISIENVFFIKNSDIQLNSKELKENLNYITNSITASFFNDDENFKFSSKKNN